MDDTAQAIVDLLAEQGVIDITIGPLEEDASLGITVRYLTQVGEIRHLAAADFGADIAPRLREIREFELDPR